MQFSGIAPCRQVSLNLYRVVSGALSSAGQSHESQCGAAGSGIGGEFVLLQDAGGSRQLTGSALEGKTPRFPGQMWLLSLLICSLVVAATFVYFDVPIAHRVYGIFGSAKSLASGFASFVLLSIEAAVALALMITRIFRGRLSPFREATALACLTSICAYAINDSILKHLFGVPNPGVVLYGTQHVFNFLKGTSQSSFPSGHMVLAAAFAGVFMRLYRKSISLFSALLLIAAALLIVGDWHFVSDVVAGAFFGISAGLLAGKLWLVHSR